MIPSAAHTSYWRTYSDPAEAQEQTKRQWSTVSVANGIVEAAIQVVAAHLHPRYTETLTLHHVGYHLKHTTADQYWHRLRVAVLGLSQADTKDLSDLAKELTDQSREFLCLCILPRSICLSLPSDAPWVEGNALFIYPDDVDALARNDWTLDELLEYKFYRSHYLDKPGTETQFDQRLIAAFRENIAKDIVWQKPEDVLHASGENTLELVRHPLAERVMASIQRRRPCLVIGPSSSGKTILAFEVADQLSRDGTSSRYLNFSAVPGEFPAALGDFASVDAGSVVMLDDLQSNPQAARYLALAANLRRRTGADGPLGVIALCWPDFAQTAADTLEDCIPLYVRAKDVREPIINNYKSHSAAALDSSALAVIQDDLRLLTVFFIVREQVGGTVTSLHDIAGAYWAIRSGTFASDPAAKRVVLIVATLGRYDVLVPREFVQHKAKVSQKFIESLISNGVVRVSRGLLTLGHRSLSALLADWFADQGLWADFRSAGGPYDPFALVRDYLRESSPSLALETLRALCARAGFKQSEKLNSNTAALVATWRAFNALLERIEHQQSQDPTWGGVLSSIVFAIQAFAYVDKKIAAAESIRFLRTRYRVEDSGEIDIHISDVATTKDFDLILEAIIAQDSALGSVPVGWEAASSIDIGRFHATWLAGIVLCAEAVYRGDFDPTLSALADAVAARQLECGAFYPQRAVWSTARVCLGLAAAGKSIHTYPPLRKAIDWLLRPRERGGAQDGVLWRSGTGEWNSDIECTSMVVLACLASGVDPDIEPLRLATRYLISQKETWISSGSELDGALAAQAYLEAGGDWSEVSGHVQHLSAWAQGEAFWRQATLSSSESFEQSCRVAQTASHLLAIGWSAIRADLPGLLQALDSPERLGLWRATGLVIEPATALVRSSSEVDTIWTRGTDLVDSLEALESLRLEDVQVVGRYCRFEERVRSSLRHWMSRITANFQTKTDTRENFLIWASPGSGKTFFVLEIAESLKPAVQFYELNLAKLNRDAFTAAVKELSHIQAPLLCLVDEVDSRREEAWPYEALFPHLDRNIASKEPTVFVLVGSSAKGRHGMIAEMKQRPKGKDLLDRIPTDRVFEIPPMCPEDRVVIFAASVRAAMSERGIVINELEKLALYYVVTNKDLASPRQLRDLAHSAVARADAADQRLHYDQLFAVGDRRNQEFWAKHQEATRTLSQLYVAI